MSEVDDHDLYRQIDQLSDQELRGVIKYLVLLNAEAVQNALNYTFQQRQKNQPAAPAVEDSFEAEFTSEFDISNDGDDHGDNEDEPPSPTKSPRSVDSGVHDDSLSPPAAHAMTPNKLSYTNSADSTATPQISNITGSKMNVRLLILCAMKPSTNQQAIDQDDAMVFCKHIGVSLPYIVLAENKPEKTLELQQISKIQDHYPQFFVALDDSLNYVGSLDDMRQFKKDGILTCEQDLYKLVKSQQANQEQDGEKRQLDYQDKKQSTTYSGIPEHLQSRRDYEQPQAADLYEHLLNLASSPLTRKPDSDDTAGDDELQPDSGPMEPPEGGPPVLKDKNANREPPAKSPPHSAKKAIRARDGTENEIGAPELATTEPAPATPNRKAKVVNITEPPALSPPMTTTKAQRRTHQQEQDGLAVSTPNAQVVKRYHTQGNKPEPTPGGAPTLRMDPIPMEPPSTRKENPSTGQYVPESPMDTVQEGGGEATPSSTPGEQQSTTEQQDGQPQAAASEHQTPSSPVDDEILAILNGVGACYLVYNEAEQGGQLSIFYSETPMDQAVGVWSSNDITEFKQAQGLGEKEFIGNCATACQESPANYFKGWSQFIKAAKSMNGTVITLTKFGMPIDFYTYSNNGGDAICEKVPGIQFETAGVDAVACLPKGTEFDYETLRGRKWTKQAKKLGSVATFNSLVHNTGVPTSGSGTPKAGTPTSIGGGIPRSLDVPSYPVDDSTVAVTVALPEEPKDGYPSAMEAPNPEGGACYLVYEPESSGRLIEQFSKTPVEGAIGRWVPGPGKNIAGFKFKNNNGKSVLIGNCSAGVQGRKNYCSGWNQFVRHAKIQDGEVMLWDPVEGVKGLPVDVWIYTNDSRPGYQSQKLGRGVSKSINDSTLAVSTIPKNTDFFEGISVDILKWLSEGSNSGASSKFE